MGDVRYLKFRLFYIVMGNWSKYLIYHKYTFVVKFVLHNVIKTLKFTTRQSTSTLHTYHSSEYKDDALLKVDTA